MHSKCSAGIVEKLQLDVVWRRHDVFSFRHEWYAQQAILDSYTAELK